MTPRAATVNTIATAVADHLKESPPQDLVYSEDALSRIDKNACKSMAEFYDIPKWVASEWVVRVMVGPPARTVLESRIISRATHEVHTRRTTLCHSKLKLEDF